MLRSAFKVMHDVGDGLDRQAVEFIATTCSASVGIQIQPLIRKFVNPQWESDAEAIAAMEDLTKFVFDRVQSLTVDGEQIDPAAFAEIIPIRTIWAMAQEIAGDRFTKKAKPSGPPPESPAPATATES